jgi:hypothetical protein
MAASARKYLLLDASILPGYFIPSAAKGKGHERVRILIEAVRKRAVDDLVLYVPNVCIPEVFSAFAKHKYGGRWNKDIKQPIDARRYKTVRQAFARYIHNGAVFHQYQLNRYHVLATDLIAPIDHYYRLRRVVRASPMSATDHIIIAMGIELSRLHGRDSVAVLTADTRMVGAMKRAATLNQRTAATLALPERADQLGYRWRRDIYPHVVDLARAPVARLRDLFGDWPLPTRSPKGKKPRATGINW